MLFINDVISIIVNRFNYRESIKYLIIQLNNIFIKSIKYSFKDIEIS